MRIGERIRKYMLSYPDEAPDGLSLLDEAKLAELGKWFAGAVTLLAGLFGFLGMEGGALGRMLRLYPNEAMLTFCLVGAALLCSMLAPAVRAGYRLRLHLFVLGVLGFLLTSAWSLPNLHNARAPAFPLHYAYAALLALAVLSWRLRISLRGAAIVSGVALLTAGIYAGIKLSVLSKRTERRVPSVNISVQPHEHSYLVQLRVRASALTDTQWVALEISYDDNVSSLRLDPNELGELDGQAEVPIPENADQVMISSQLCDTTCDNQPIVENAALVLPSRAPAAATETSISAATEAPPPSEPRRSSSTHPPSKRRGD